MAKKIGNPTSIDLNLASELYCLFIDRNLSIAIETVVYIDPTLAICTNPRLKNKIEWWLRCNDVSFLF